MAIATWELEDHQHCCPSAHPARPDLRVVPQRTARRAPRPSARVYARRRRAVLVLALGGVAVAAMAVAGPATGATAEEAAGVSATPPSAPVPASAGPMVVAEGETVWGLVLPHVPAGADAQAYVAEVLDRNGLEATAVAPGTVVHLP